VRWFLVLVGWWGQNRFGLRRGANSSQCVTGVAYCHNDAIPAQSKTIRDDEYAYNDNDHDDDAEEVAIVVEEGIYKNEYYF
jgi:hypothetical protein